MNPRQRRGALLLTVAVIGAVGAFVLVARFVADVERQLGPMATVLEVTSDIAAYEPIDPQDVTAVEIPERWTPRSVITDPLELAGLVAAAELPAGSLLQPGMLTPAPSVQEGQREIAILVDAETGVAGKIGSGSIVDIYATFPATETEPAAATIVVQRARIIDVGTPESAPADGRGFSEGQVVPVTFALSVEDSLRLTYVESFASTVRLALRAPDDSQDVSATDRSYSPRGERP